MKFLKIILITALFSLFIQPLMGTEKVVVIGTPYGEMKVRLYDQTPQHRDNFIKLVEEAFYDSLLFHRVIKNFMIQGGDPGSKNAASGKNLGAGDLGYTVPAEFVSSLFHKKGALSAARQSDFVNPTKASSACQFYVVQGRVYSPNELDAMEKQTGKTFSKEQRDLYSTLGGTPFLDGDYTVFGEVTEGLEIIDKIAQEKTNASDRPLQDIKMTIRIQK